MRILITGTSGLTGKDLCLNLLTKTDIPLVIVYHQKIVQEFVDIAKQRGNVDFVKLDLKNKSDVENCLLKYQPTHLVHLAWDGIARNSRNVNITNEELALLNWEWLKISINLLDLFALHGGEFFICAGTAHEYVATTLDRNEETPCKPLHPYSQCKYSLSQMVKSVAMCRGIKLLWLRLFYIVNTETQSETNIILQALSAIRNNQPFETWINPETEFDFITTKDIANIIRRLIEKGVEGEFNLGSAKSINVYNLLYSMFDKANKLNLFHHNQPYRSKERVVADISKLKQEIGDFTFTDVSQVLTSKDYGE